MIDYVYKDLYKQNSVKKNLSITFAGGEITNDDLYLESFELTESLCSEDALRFGSCEASCLKLKIINKFDSLKDVWLSVFGTLDNNTDNPFEFGQYKVYSDTPTADRRHRELVAYDRMFDIINSDVSEWYNSIFPDADSIVTMKQFRDGFSTFFGIEQEEVTLINDDMVVEKTIEPSALSGKDVLSAICEINGCFGHISRNGKLRYVLLKSESHIVDRSQYSSCKYEDYVTDKISKLQIRQEENDIGVMIGEGNNCYIVQDNFLVYGKGTEVLKVIGNNLYEVISQISYRPFDAELKGNPCIEVGDSITIETSGIEITSYILERTLKGIHALKDSVCAKGTKEYAEQLNSVRTEVTKLKNKTNILERSIEETKSTISDIEKGIQTQIKQNSESIKMIVEQNKLSDKQLSEIALEVSYVLNRDGILKNSAIEYYTTTEIPTLLNYPTFTNFFVWDICSDELCCSDDLICGVNDYDSHLNEVTRNENTNKYYIFELVNGKYVWRELTEDEVENLSEKHASLKVFEDEVVISASVNEESASLRITPKGIGATVLFCC